MPNRIDYAEAARRHYKDAALLIANGRRANAGQLLGFCVECGLKALLIASGVTPDSEGGIPSAQIAKASGTQHGKFRQHMPVLGNTIISMGHLIPDGARTTKYMANLITLSSLDSWSVDHRYYRESAIPLEALPDWEKAAKEVNEMLENATIDGVI